MQMMVMVMLLLVRLLLLLMMMMIHKSHSTRHLGLLSRVTFSTAVSFSTVWSTGDRLGSLSGWEALLVTSTTASGAAFGFTTLILKRFFFRQKSKLHSTMSRLLLVSSRCIVVVFWSIGCPAPLLRTRVNAARNWVFMPT
uniref:Secreted protein n=1 Tax=Anopheles farauti TaxID=69004 RepID=A0A182Q8D6_9DIPT